MPINVLGSELIDCSLDPLTGFYRDGCCNTGADDFGVHTVCAIVTDEFLEFSKKSGDPGRTGVFFRRSHHNHPSHMMGRSVGLSGMGRWSLQSNGEQSVIGCFYTSLRPVCISEICSLRSLAPDL